MQLMESLQLTVLSKILNVLNYIFIVLLKGTGVILNYVEDDGDQPIRYSSVKASLRHFRGYSPTSLYITAGVYLRDDPVYGQTRQLTSYTMVSFGRNLDIMLMMGSTILIALLLVSTA